MKKNSKKHGDDIYPAWDEISEAKRACYPADIQILPNNEVEN